MARRVYISLGHGERGLPAVQDLLLFLRRHGCIITFAPQSDEWSFYPLLEEAIERCDVFVAVAGAGYDGSSWLAHEVTYADQLARWHMGRRVPHLCVIGSRCHPTWNPCLLSGWSQVNTGQCSRTYRLTPHNPACSGPTRAQDLERVCGDPGQWAVDVREWGRG